MKKTVNKRKTIKSLEWEILALESKFRSYAIASGVIIITLIIIILI